MSDITVGSEWIDAGGTDLIVTDITEHHIEFIYRSKYGRSLNEMEIDLFKSLFKPVEQEKEDDSADMVNNPPHYKDESGIECIEVTKHMQFCGGNCFKYLYRAGKKGSTIEDLKKAIWYADKAKFDNEKVCWSAITGINTVASVKNKNIGAAMNYISTEDWQWVIVSIKAEIARLESEAADD